jgi:hypothetical protein
MFVRSEGWKKLSLQERRAARLASWASTNGLNFESKEAEESYGRRTKLPVGLRLSLDSCASTDLPFPLTWDHGVFTG